MSPYGQAPRPVPNQMAQQANSAAQKQVGAMHRPPMLANNGTVNNPEAMNQNNNQMKMAGMAGMGKFKPLSASIAPMLQGMIGAF